jgi:hypothetical protein
MKKIIITLVLIITLISGSCSGYIGLNNITVRIDVPGTSTESLSRHVASDVEVVHLRGTQVYGYLQSDISAGSTTFSMPGIPVDDYVLVALLINTGDEVVGFAAKDVTIEAGFNELPITIGPGLNPLKINGNTINDPFGADSGYTMGFAHNTIIINTGGRDPDGDEVLYTPYFGTDVTYDSVVIDSVETIENRNLGSSPWTVNPDETGLVFTMTYDNQTYTQIIKIR